MLVSSTGSKLVVLRGPEEETGSHGRNEQAQGEKKLADAFLSPETIKRIIRELCDSSRVT